MEESPEIAATLRRFYDRLTAGDLSAFDHLVSASPRTSIMGTAPGEWVTERDRLRFGFETEGVGLTAGPNPKAYGEGTLGYAIDEPLFSFPDGSAIRIRLTTIWRREDGTWKLVHGHFSVGVPDEEVADLQKRWGIT
jgi:hypothetical protein